MRKTAPTLLAVGALVIIGAILILAMALPRQVAAPDLTPSPSVTPSPTASPTATASPSATPTVAPAPTNTSPSAAGRYVNPDLGYSIETPSPWRLAACGTASFVHQGVLFANDVFVRVTIRDEAPSSTGLPYANVRVAVEGNPQNLTPRQWAEQGRTVGSRLGERIEDVVYADRPAARKVYDTSPLATYFVANAGRMYVVVPSPGPTPIEATVQQAMVRIVDSFRFATAAEIAVARAAARTPRPARSPETLADAIAIAFAAKNVNALADLLVSCVSMGVENAGGTGVSRERYLDDLGAAFAAGLTVAVRARPLEGDPASGNLTIGSTWTDQRGVRERKLMLLRGDNDRWELLGTLDRLS